MKSPHDEARLVHVPVDIVRRKTGKDKRDGDDGVLYGFAVSVCVCLGEGDAEVDDGELRRH